MAAGAVIVGAGYGAWLIGGWGGPALIRVLDDVGLVFFALGAAFCAGRAAFVLRGRDRAAWVFLATGTAGWAAGEAMWSYHDLVAGTAPFPSWADAGYLSFLVGAGMCLILLLTVLPAGTQLRVLLDGLIVAAAIFGAAWVTWLQTVYAAQDHDVVSVAFALVYPVVDIALITVAALTCLRAAASRRPYLALMTAGLVAIAASDTAFGYLTATDGYNDHHEIAIGWAWGFSLLGFAAVSAARESSAEAGPQTTTVSRWLPYVPVLLSGVLCTPVLIARLGPVFVAVAVIVVAVVIRQFLILGENRRLRAGAAAAAPAPVAVSSPMLDELRDAIDHSGLRMLYQPQFDLRTRRIVGVEALIRWPHPCRGVLSPDQFLPLVNQRVLMRALTDAVLDLALDDVARWYAEGFRLPVGVNVFAPTISDPELGPAITAGLQRRGLPPEALIVEITEDRLLADMSGTRAALEALRDSGVRVALDDFGTGYSALGHLRDLPVDQVKLDREFIAQILTHPTSATIVRTVIGMAHALGLTPVAEGVENAEVVDRLCEYGCRVAQGFYFSRPLPAAEMSELLETQRRAHAATLAPTDPWAPDAVKSN
ncbi:hypothetical protein ASG82_02055 [Mycobacterium sp. Soil538]|nr:hypothetical protein ASG82_02055 [Mycobacterium sp. Soil538]